MPNAPQGDFVYINFLALSGVETFVTIKAAIDEKSRDVTCNVRSGDTILIRHPNKLYLSFRAKDVDNKFFINASYAAELTSDSYDNVERCSDKGANLGDIIKDNSGNGSSGGSAIVPDPSSPQVKVLSKSKREGLTVLASQEVMIDENATTKKSVQNDDKTFKILLLVVGLLLIVVAALMLANTYVTRKHLNSNTVEHAQIRESIER